YVLGPNACFARLPGMSDEAPDTTEAQRVGLTDMAPDEFRRAAHEVVDLIADYLEHVEGFAVFPAVAQRQLRSLFPATPPEQPEPLETILRDVGTLIEPN